MPPKIDWENDPEHIELMKFLIERTKDATSPLGINTLAREFKEKSGSSQTVPCFNFRIQKLRERVAELDTIDTETKVKMMFALSVSIDKNLLNELQKNADVEIDGNNRITKYRAKDGSLELEGDQSRLAQIMEILKQRMRGSQEDSSDLSQDSMPKTPGSVKRSAVDVQNSSKRTRTDEVKSEDSAPEDSVRIPLRKPASSNPETQLLRQPKLEGDPGAEEAPITSSRGAPRASGSPAPIRPRSEATDAYTPQIKFLESIQFLILNLDTPSLSPLQAKIDEKLRESSPNAKIANDEMKLAMELLATKITNHSMPVLTENVESVSLKVFLCFLQAAILYSKLEGLESLLEKIKERIKEPASKDKNIPIEKVISVLQHTQKMTPEIDWKNDPECIELMNFVIERTKDAKSPLSINKLAKEFKKKSGSSRAVHHFEQKMLKLSEKPAELDTDTATKVKMMFALSVPIDDDFLNELQKDAEVKLDEYERITEYRAKDGSLELGGYKGSMRQCLEAIDICRNNQILREGGTPPRASRKRVFPDPETQFRNLKEIELKLEGDPGARPLQETPASSASGAPTGSKSEADRAPAPKPTFEHSNQEPLSGSMDILSHSGVEEPPSQGIQEFREPKREIESPEALGAPEASAPAPEASRPPSGLNDAYTPQIKLLEAIKSLVISLDMPSLSPLQEKIEKKLRESSPDENIPNDEMILVMDLLVARIAKNSESNLAENVESVSFKEFLCYLKCVILSLKLEGLEVLLEKIKERIKELTMKDKNIPVEKVISVLQHTLDGI